MLQAESKRSENVKSKSMSDINTHEASDEMMKEQLKLWRVAEKKEQWNDVPAKVKVKIPNQLIKYQYFDYFSYKGNR